MANSTRKHRQQLKRRQTRQNQAWEWFRNLPGLPEKIKQQPWGNLRPAFKQKVVEAHKSRHLVKRVNYVGDEEARGLNETKPRISPTATAAALAALLPADDQVDTTDIPEAGEEFFEQARLVLPDSQGA